MQLRYAAWYVASFAPAAFMPWICGSADAIALPVKAKKLKEIHLELAYLPSPYREETVHFSVSIGGQ